jgi:photosystem II stability/assembly factor-like uncharacterized protein
MVLGLTAIVLAAAATGHGSDAVRPGAVITAKIAHESPAARLARTPVDVRVVTPDHGVLALANGTRIETLDGGRTWHSYGGPDLPADPVLEPPSPPPACARESRRLVASRDAERATAVCGGESAPVSKESRVYTTSDGGRTWRSAGTAPPGGYALRFIPGGASILAVTAVAGGDRLYLAPDGAHGWRGIGWFGGILAWPAPNVGYAIPRDGGDGLYRTLDAGRTWVRVYPPIAPSGPISFADARHAIGAGAPDPGGGAADGRIYATDDGGATWQARGEIPGAHVQQLERLSRRTLIAVAAPVGRDGVAYPWNGPVYRTDDDGAHWRRVGRLPGFGTIDFLDARVGFDHKDDFGSAVLRTDDGGASWRRVGASPLTSIGFVSARDGFGVNLNSELVRTRDGAGTWHVQPVAIPGFDVDRVAAAGGAVWITGTVCARRKCAWRILRSRDRGRHWVLVRVGDAISDLSLSTPNTAVARVSNDAYVTADGGANWRLLPLVTVPH